MTTLFCIKHQRMVRAEGSPPVHFETIQVSRSADPGDRFDFEECDFPLGFAFCPPPKFDLEAYMEKVGEPPAIIGGYFVEAIYTV